MSEAKQPTRQARWRARYPQSLVLEFLCALHHAATRKARRRIAAMEGCHYTRISHNLKELGELGYIERFDAIAAVLDIEVAA